MNTKGQSGNVLFLILIAVVLFAALSYAVTSSTRSGGGDVSTEQTQTGLAQFLNYATAIEQAIMRLKISKSCADSQLSWESPNWGSFASAYVNSATPSDGHCKIFDPAGGSISFQKPPASILSGIDGLTSYAIINDYLFDARRPVNGMGLTQDAQPDGYHGLTNEVTIRAQVTKKTCELINQKYRGTTTIPTDNWPYFGFATNVDAPGGQQPLGLPDFCPECSGQPTMCFLQTGGPNPSYQLYYVILTR